MRILKNCIRVSPLFCGVFLLLLNFRASAQEPCGNELYDLLLKKHPVWKAEFDAVNRAVYQAGNTQRVNGTILEIPVAVHILHLGEPVGTGTNLSDAVIYDALRGANERWRNIGGAGVDMEVQFCLAQYDPQGNPGNGIVRVNASSVPNYTQYGISYIGALGEPGADETTIKNLSNWPHNYVYNIWVVNKIAGDWGGYALFPGNSNYANDGTVIIASAIRYNSSTLAHELGHGMGLFHTFQGLNESICPDNLICSLQGDWVCDTPPHKKEDCISTSCSNSADSILALSFKNIMSYCGGRNLFTAGQKTRSRNTIMNSSRRQLLTSNACYRPCDTVRTQLGLTTCDLASAGIRQDTLATSAGCDSIITTTTTLLPGPSAAFTFSSAGLQVIFENQSQHATAYHWDFGDDSTAAALHPAHEYSAAGTYNVTLVAENSCRSDTASETVTLILTSLASPGKHIPVRIYPNPNNGTFMLETGLAETEAIKMNIMNALGQTVEEQQFIPGKQQTVTLKKKHPKGIYQIQFLKADMIIGRLSFLLNQF